MIYSNIDIDALVSFDVKENFFYGTIKTLFLNIRPYERDRGEKIIDLGCQLPQWLTRRLLRLFF